MGDVAVIYGTRLSSGGVVCPPKVTSAGGVDLADGDVRAIVMK